MATTEVSVDELVDSIPWYDEDAIYETKPLELIPEDPVSDIFLSHQPQLDLDSATRATRRGGEHEPLILGRETSDYVLSVERLMWVDGWRQSTGDEAHRQRHGEMTLVVLKLTFSTKTPNSRISYARAELRFKAGEKRGKDPEVVAWGPFRHPETWNVAAAKRRINIKNEQKVELGYAGQKGTLGRTAEDETSWDRVDFDIGKSTPLSNLQKAGAKPNGVMWTVGHNQTHQQGITPELRVGLLLSRASSAPYRVDFRLTAYTGALSALRDRASGFLGLPRDSVVWKATPNAEDLSMCYAEGASIIQSVHTDNLGDLVSATDNTHLNPTWLDAWERFEVPKAQTEPEASEKEGDATTAAATTAAAVAAAAAIAAAAAVAAAITPAAKPAEAEHQSTTPNPSNQVRSQAGEAAPAANRAPDPAQTLASKEHPQQTIPDTITNISAVAEAEAADVASHEPKPPPGSAAATASAVTPEPGRGEGVQIETTGFQVNGNRNHPSGFLGRPYSGDFASTDMPTASTRTYGRARANEPAAAGPSLRTANALALDYPDDYGRLVSLEARAAQAEARIAAQDQLIYKLQLALAKVEQVLSTRDW